VSPLALTAAGIVVFLGAVLQGSIGFGLGLMAAPLLVLIDPRLVPAPLLLASGVLTVLLTHRDRHAIITGDLKWSLGGRILGTLPALGVLTAVPGDRLGIAFGVLVLLGVGLSFSTWRFRPSPRVLLGAGALSGFMATIAAIGGPPMALVYQHESGPRIRGTLSAYFVVGVTISLIGLAWVGRFGRGEAVLAAVLLPAILAGYWVSRHTARQLDRGSLRPVILAVSAASALAVIVEHLIWRRPS
jgi:uncharacterized membrane protein YfcA